jgi:hypothetical protein
MALSENDAGRRVNLRGVGVADVVGAATLERELLLRPSLYTDPASCLSIDLPLRFGIG